MAQPGRVVYARILDIPHASSLRDAVLHDMIEEGNREGRDLVLDYFEVNYSQPPQISLQQGRPVEKVRGILLPRRIRFRGLRWIKRSGLYEQISAIPNDHGSRSLRGMLAWKPPGKEPFYLLMNGSDTPATLMFSTESSLSEEPPTAMRQEGQTCRVYQANRDWSPPPPLTPGLVPFRKAQYRKYGGDSIIIQLQDKILDRRLFIGGIDFQTDVRPRVHAVLNLSEEPSLWVKAGAAHPGDRWANKGEGKDGMSVGEILEEAGWVVDRLSAGQRVLVHCSAGLNRSTTICCAVLMRLEGLSAEDALARVRERHPWARPDPHHWLALKWIGQR